MRYLLDTNILIFLILGEEDLSNTTIEIVSDYINQLHTSSVCIIELIQLHRIGKFKSKLIKNTADIFSMLESLAIKILPFSLEHSKKMALLNVVKGHNEPFDHAVISQAINDKLILVSSGNKMEDYQDQKLSFHFNKR